MNFTAYIERQKNLIRDRHEGDVYLVQNGDFIPVTESDKLFADLKKSRGLNTRERMRYGKAV